MIASNTLFILKSIIVVGSFCTEMEIKGGSEGEAKKNCITLGFLLRKELKESFIVKQNTIYWSLIH